jgi:hypothetical protein
VAHDRRGGRRVRVTGGALEYHDDPPLQREWAFPEPMGRRPVIIGFTMTDVVTIPSHLSVADVSTCMAVDAARDLADASTPPPEAVDALGRSEQTFVVEVVVRAAGVERRATARGQDIYAVTAPLVAEAVQRILAGQTLTTGVASAGAMFDAADFLRALAPHITVELPAPERADPAGARSPSTSRSAMLLR